MERLENNEELRKWSDHIPLRWKYTAGVAGDRFLHLLKQGKIQASVCKNCGGKFIPPKIYCKDCFVQINDWKEVPADSGYVYSFTEMKGEHIVALVKFIGFEGGLIGRLKLSGRDEPKIGTKVRVVFKPKDSRKGDISDIAYFEKSLPS
ncbi:MAG: Zn-ribbon domain-containing OB-fold protein [Nitrososphaerales archaeon]